MNQTTHAWRFFRSGGFDQVRIDRGVDVLALPQLDQKLWVALSCPVAGVEFDAATLALLDHDGDGHIRAPELLAAIKWVAERLKDSSALEGERNTLQLAAIDDTGEAGKRVLASARRILKNLGKTDEAISIDDAADSARIFGDTRFNGDGIITARSADDEKIGALIETVIAAYGAQTDRSGEPGIDGPTLTQAISDARALTDWEAAGSAVTTEELGDASAAYSALTAVREKIDDYFARCRLASYDARAETLLNGNDADFSGFAADNLAVLGEPVARLPLARTAAGQALPLDERLNPAWQTAMSAFVDAVVTPLLGAKKILTEAQWKEVCARMQALRAWREARPTAPIDALDADTRAALIADEAALNDLLAQDLALADEAAGIDEVAKLARLARDLLPFANNFVAFKSFYSRDEQAMFQSGTLYFDGRSCELCIDVLDPTRHAALATLSRICLVYCNCVRKGEQRSIAAAFTAGDSDQLMVGRNGVFYDRDGLDWDATVVKIIDHPISLRQAFWSPYRKIARFASEQMQKFAAAKAQQSEAAAVKQVAAGGKAIESAAPAKAAPPAFDVGKFAGIFAAIGLAVGAIGTAIAAALAGFFGLVWWQMPIALAGLILLISGPAVLVAWFKLRSRTLGPILDANGWAINARAAINIPLGTSLTQRAALPEGSERNLSDPYAQKSTPWFLYLVLGIALGVAIYLLATGT